VVDDLTRRDFRIVEEGAPQAISVFEHVVLPRIDRPGTTPVIAVPQDTTSNDEAAQARIFVLVLDALHVSSRRTLAVRRLAREFVENHVAATDLVAVVSTGGSDAVKHEFTSDKARLVSAINQFSGARLRSATVERDEEIQTASGGMRLHSGRDPSDAERAARVESFAKALEALAVDLDSIKGRRKSVLLFSEGIDYNVFDALGVVQRYSGSVSRAIGQLLDAFVATNVAVYPIDPRGLSSSDIDRIETPLHSQPTRTNDVVNPGVEGEYAASIQSLRSLAESTGGFAAVNTNVFADAFRRIVEDSSDYYVLGYTPTQPVVSRKFREIKVSVLRSDVRVVARRGYVGGRVDRGHSSPIAARRREVDPKDTDKSKGGSMSSTVQGVSAEVEELLGASLPTAGLSLRVQTIPFRSRANRALVHVVIEVPGRSLDLAEHDGLFAERVELALLAVDDRGRSLIARKTAIEVRLPREQVPQLEQTGLRWISAIELPAGRNYRLRVAGRVERTGLSGLVVHFMDVPRFRF
jgi:VWFA-related protein